MATLRKERQSGIKLARIFAIICVIVLHFNSNGFGVQGLLSVNKNIMMLTESITICAVDLFMLISGYFLCKSQKRSVAKIIDLYLMMYCAHFAVYFLTGAITHTITIGGIIRNLLPTNYFLNLYTVVYILSPYVNIILDKLDKKHLGKFLVIVLVIFSVWNTGWSLFEEICGMEFRGSSTIGMYGTQNGFTSVNFMMMYLVGAYMRASKIDENIKTNHMILYYLVCVLLILIWAYANERFKGIQLRSAWEYNNPLVVMEAALTFSIFKRIKIQSKVVNSIAKSSFMIFLLHQTLISRLPYNKIMSQSLWGMLSYLFISILIIILMSWIAYQLYTKVTQRLISKIDAFLIEKDINIEVN